MADEQKNSARSAPGPGDGAPQSTTPETGPEESDAPLTNSGLLTGDAVANALTAPPGTDQSTPTASESPDNDDRSTADAAHTAGDTASSTGDEAGAETDNTAASADQAKDDLGAEQTADRQQAAAESTASTASATAQPGATAALTATATPPEEPSDRERASTGPRRRPALAGAAIAGCILVTVPLLLLGAGDDEDDQGDKGDTSSPAAQTLLDGDAPGSGTQFVPDSPSPSSPSPSATESETPSSEKAQAGPKQPAEQPPPADRPETKKAEAKAEKTKEAEETPDKKAVTQPGPSNVLIKNWANGTCIDIPGIHHGEPGGKIQQSYCIPGSGDNQMWSLEALPGMTSLDDAQLYVIRNVKDGLCLDLPGNASVALGSPVTESPCNRTTGDNQLWWLEKRAESTYWIRNHASLHYCLNVEGHRDKSMDVPLTLNHCSDTDDQRWQFTRS